MHFASNAVPNKFAHDRKTISASLILNLGADIAHAPAFMGDADCARERVFGCTQQLVRALFDDSNRNSRGVIPNPTILNNADVELHDVAILNAPLAANAVDHFVVKGDANVPGKNAMPQAITQKCAFYAGIAHKVGGCRSTSVVVIPGRTRSATQSRMSLAVRQACRIFSISRVFL